MAVSSIVAGLDGVWRRLRWLAQWAGGSYCETAPEALVVTAHSSSSAGEYYLLTPNNNLQGPVALSMDGKRMVFSAVISDGKGPALGSLAPDADVP